MSNAWPADDQADGGALSFGFFACSCLSRMANEPSIPKFNFDRRGIPVSRLVGVHGHCSQAGTALMNDSPRWTHSGPDHIGFLHVLA
jgi:hypothetical protein